MKLLLASLLIPAIVFMVFAVRNTHENSRAALHEQIGISTYLSSLAIDEFVAHHLSAVVLLAERDPPPASWTTELKHLQQDFAGVRSAIVTDSAGHVIATYPVPHSDPSQSRPSVADRDYFKTPSTSGRPYVSNAFRGRRLGTDPLVAVSAPLYQDGEFNGVVQASLRIEAFARERAAAFKRRGWEMVILDRDASVIFASSGTSLQFMQSLKGSAFIDPEAPVDGATQPKLYTGLLDEGAAGWVSQSAMRSGWRLVLIAPHDLVLTRARETAWILLGAIVITTLGGLAAAWWQMRSLDAGVNQVMTSLHRLASNLDSEVSEADEMPSELRPVGRAIGTLASNLRAARGELQRALEEQQRLSASLHATIAARDQEVAARTAELSAANAELERLTKTDALTGVLNVRGLHECLSALSTVQGTFQQPTAVLAIDVDHFKKYNDRYGHPAGDRVIARVANAIQGALRDAGDVVARAGGEEFAVVLPGADQAAALAVAERIRSLVQALDILHEDTAAGRVSVSVGATNAAAGSRVDVAMKSADEALYRAKHAGRDRVAYF